MTGKIEENVNFDQLIGTPPAELVINTKGVTRINSVGVKAWIKFFQAAAAKGAKLTFTECSTAIVEQINLISNFTCGGVVESIYVPFSCEPCKKEMVALFKTDALKAAGFKFPEMKCDKGACQAVFDDIPEEYFHFLMKK